MSGIAEVLRFTWNFDRVNRPRIEGLRLEIAPDIPVLHLRTPADVEGFLQSCA